MCSQTRIELPRYNGGLVCGCRRRVSVFFFACPPIPIDIGLFQLPSFPEHYLAKAKLCCFKEPQKLLPSGIWRTPYPWNCPFCHSPVPRSLMFRMRVFPSPYVGQVVLIAGSLWERVSVPVRPHRQCISGEKLRWSSWSPTFP